MGQQNVQLFVGQVNYRVSKNMKSTNSTAGEHSGGSHYSACLFIGGPENGRRRVVPDGYAHMRTMDGNGDHHEYRRELLGAPGKTWRIFVHAQLPLDAAIDMLISGYLPNVDAAQDRSGSPFGVPHCSAETAAELYRLLEHYRNFMPCCVGMTEVAYSSTQEAKNADAALVAYRKETGRVADIKPSETNV